MSDETNVSPVINKPEDPDLVSKLERKLDEYKKRLSDSLGEYQHPELAYMLSSSYRDSLFKSLVLEELLTAGKVVTYDLSRKLFIEHAPFDVQAFQNACGVVDMYCGNTEVKLVRAGTGLK